MIADKRVTVVAQGGGMRGVYSMGALEALALSTTYERVAQLVGSSAGALNATYVVSGQPREGVEMYVKDLSNKNFINPLRPWCMVNIDFLVDVVLKKLHPLRIEEFREARPLLRIVATDATTGGAVEFTNRDDHVDIYEVLRATAALPALYNKQVRIGERTYVDGGVVDGLPVIRALDRSDDILLAISTRPLGYRSKGHGALYGGVGRSLARGQSAQIKARIGRIDSAVNGALSYISDTPGVTLWEAHGSVGRRLNDGRIVVLVHPGDPSCLVGRTTSDEVKLEACAEMGRRDMNTALDQLLKASSAASGD
jgi:predicted acylesterase/phospholipase RssA